MDRRALLTAVSALAAVPVLAPAQSVSGGAAPPALGSASDSTAVDGGTPSRASRFPVRDAPPLGAAIELPPTRLIDGTVLAPSYWQDKVLVVELWATWCPFCSRQNPFIDKLHRSGAPGRLEVLGLALDRRVDDVARYMKQRGFGFHAALFDDGWYRAIGRPKGLPVVWVVGRDRTLKQIETREMHPEDVEELVRWV